MFSREEIKEKVAEYVERNLESRCPELYKEQSEKEHIINIATSIYCTKNNIGSGGGSFVRAFVENNLEETIARADDTNIKALSFYVMFSHCFSPY